jgi:hypothetical protein
MNRLWRIAQAGASFNLTDLSNTGVEAPIRGPSRDYLTALRVMIEEADEQGLRLITMTTLEGTTLLFLTS